MCSKDIELLTEWFDLFVVYMLRMVGLSTPPPPPPNRITIIYIMDYSFVIISMSGNLANMECTMSCAFQNHNGGHALTLLLAEPSIST